jgi:CRISPR-associated endoribonuclease Cas6
LINKGSSVPFHHQYLLAGYVELLLKKYAHEYKKTTAYNFSGLKGQIKVGKEGLYFYSSKVTLVFSSPDQAFMEFFLSKLFQQPQIEIGRMLLMPLSVERENMPEPQEEMKYLCISPIVVVDPIEGEEDPKMFMNPTADEFSDYLYESIMIRMERAGYSQEELATFYKFQVVPDRDYLSKIKDDDKKFARVFTLFDNGNKYDVRGYTFPFTLYADPKVQDFVLNNGLGWVTHKGFGMLDIANSDPNLRTTPFEVKFT